MGYLLALDGIRGVVVMLVMLYHLPLGLASAAGPVDVIMFFTLSGFLITTLLLEEHAATGRTDPARFYKRRGLRLLPGVDFGHVNHTRTLAIEEHFYLLWPFTVVLVLRRLDGRLLLRIAVVGALASWALRSGLWVAGRPHPSTVA
jgi:peptidoglycan/LPS O-acetylase OafA/YrhL